MSFAVSMQTTSSAAREDDLSEEELRGLDDDEELRGLEEEDELRGFADDEQMQGFAAEDDLRGFAEDEAATGSGARIRAAGRRQRHRSLRAAASPRDPLVRGAGAGAGAVETAVVGVPDHCIAGPR